MAFMIPLSHKHAKFSRPNCWQYTTERGCGAVRSESGCVTYTTIGVDRSDGIATVTLDRPKVLNALNFAMVRELCDALATLEADDAVRVVILTGSGDRAFAAGADIGELSALPSAIDGVAVARSGQALTLQIERMRTPVIAAVNGFALGGGCELAMACDIRIASDGARFGQPEVNLGLLPGYGGTQRTARLLGRGTAMYLCLTGEMVDATEALRVGLVQRVVPHATLLAECKRVAALIAAKAPLAIAATKRAIDDGIALSTEAGLEIEALHFGTLVGTADFAEGTQAFLAKRPAAFVGK
ncbi:MAG: enoyl-CoA hydratase-related protein [Vulcanimicrobiaceae bacterium]